MPQQPGLAPDLIIINGKVVTVDKNDSLAEAIAVNNGLIIKVGSNQEVKSLASGATEEIDLQGKTIYPGFIDTHEHCIRRGLQLDYVNCRTPPMRSLEQIVVALKEKADSKPDGEWVVGSWFDETQWEDKRFPNRYDLDRASTRHPVYLGRAGGHNSVANSLALELAGVSKDTEQPAGGHIEKDESGIPTGRLDEKAAMDMVRGIIPAPTGEEEIGLLVESWPVLRRHT